MKTLGQLCEKLEILSLTADLSTKIRQVCYDSRKVSEGDLFVAISGLSVDGNSFIQNAVDAGAVAVVCDHLPVEPVSVPYVLVEDCRHALAMLSCAEYDYPADRMRVIGVTGTSGKTTSTHLIKHILEQVTGKMVGMIGTNGNMIGSTVLHTEYTTPESHELQQLFASMADQGCAYVVMEVSSHSLYMHRVDGIRYSTAAFTNLSQDHLDLHGTMEEYAAVKRSLFSHSDRASINRDDAYADFMLEGITCPAVTTSAKDPLCDFYADAIALSTGEIAYDLHVQDRTFPVRLSIPGMFSVYNSLTALSVCILEGLPAEECVKALSTAQGVKGRVEMVPTDGDYSIIIDYSHKPDALEKVLRTLRPVTEGRLICLFGCGGDRDHDKRPKMARIAAQNSDYVIVTSDNPRTEDPQAIIDQILPGFEGTSTPYIVVCDRCEAIHSAIDMAKEGDVILLAGKGHEDYQVIGHEKIHMDEREIVADYLRERKS